MKKVTKSGWPFTMSVSPVDDVPRKELEICPSLLCNIGQEVLPYGILLFCDSDSKIIDLSHQTEDRQWQEISKR